MTINKYNNETVLCSIKTYKDIENSEAVPNTLAIIATSLFGISGSYLPTDFNLTLTTDNLYIEAIGLSAWGRLPETRYENKIPLENIKSFRVATENTKELIEFVIIKNKLTHIINKDATKEELFTLIRNNENYDNLALEMSNLISKEK